MSETQVKAVPQSENSSMEQLYKIYQSQQKNLLKLKNTSIADRLKKIKTFRKTVIAHRKDIQSAIFKDFRKSAIQVDFTEIYPVVAECKLFEHRLHEWLEPKEVETPLIFIGSQSKIMMEAKGRVLILSPWNYPFQIPVRNMIAAYAAGNAIIIKPSEFTPNTSALLQKILAEVFNENEIAVVQGDHSVAQELLSMRFDHIHYTGSPAVGKLIMKAAAENLTSVTLELGGKSPAIIDETANLKKTARNLVWSKFLNVGQTCIAADYVFIHESRKDEFVKLFKEEISKSFHNNPKTDESFCRIINSKHFTRISKLMEDAIEKGAKIELGAEVDASENYIGPTVLSHLTSDMKILQEEIFGPVLPLLTYKNIDEVIAYINNGEKPLALYIYSNSNKNQSYIVDNTSSGAVGINESIIHNGHSELPFGGVNNSGIGKSHGLYGLKEFSNEKPILKAWNAPSNLLTPPYNKFSQTMVDTMIKFL